MTGWFNVVYDDEPHAMHFYRSTEILSAQADQRSLQLYLSFGSIFVEASAPGEILEPLLMARDCPPLKRGVAGVKSVTFLADDPLEDELDDDDDDEDDDDDDELLDDDASGRHRRR